MAQKTKWSISGFVYLAETGAEALSMHLRQQFGYQTRWDRDKDECHHSEGRAWWLMSTEAWAPMRLDELEAQKDEAKMAEAIRDAEIESEQRGAEIPAAWKV